MDLIRSEIELFNADDLALNARGYIEENQIRKLKVKALVDSGAAMLAINEHLKAQLDLRVLGRQEATLANGTKQILEIAGPVEIRFENRSTTVRAMVLPGNTEVLLGAIPMQDMDVLVNPREEKLIVNPESPFMAQKSLK